MRNWIAALALMSIATPVAAQDQTGIAFAYAPEQGSGVCTGGSPTTALDCARSRCVASSGALPADCARVAWCYPAGWSFAVGIMHREGIHWSEFSCGWPSREAALAAGKLRCDHQDEAYIADCVVGGLWDETGGEVLIEESE